MARNVELLDKDENVIHPRTSAKAVTMSGERSLQEHIGELESDMFSPVITQTSSMARLGEGDSVDVSDNVEAGYFESAVLRGQTLVNLNDKQLYSMMSSDSDSFESTTSRTNYIKTTYNGGQVSWRYLHLGYLNMNLIKPDTKYLVHLSEYQNVVSVSFADGSFADIIAPSVDIKNGCAILTTSSSWTVQQDRPILLYCTPNLVVGTPATVVVKDAMIIEYQDGMENWDIPYFEGMQSVKNPVLTTTGRNLWSFGDLDVQDGVQTFYEGTAFRKGKYNFFAKRNITYDDLPVVAFIPLSTEPYKTYITDYPRIMTLAEDMNRFVIYSNGYNWISSNGKPILLSDIMMSRGGDLTPYEPYKSNILSPLEELELLSEESTLDLISGEVYEPYGVYTPTGDEIIIIYADNDSTIGFRLKVIGLKGGSTQKENKCDSLPYSYSWGDYEHFFLDDDWMNIVISKTKANSIEEFSQYLKDNKFKFIVELKTPTIKTVNLSGSPIGFKDGHIQLSSEGLTPTLEYSVPTSRTGQITQNSTLLVKHGKQIGELELRLAQSGVTAVYDQAMLNFEMGVMSAAAETSVNYDNFITLIESGLHDNTKLQEIANMLYLHAQLSDAQYQDIMSRIQ